jgi:two-component sensor histidine kinase
LLAPYQSASNERIQISGDDPGIDDQSATPLALLFHELGTNAAKYGSLSSELGCVTLAIHVDADSTVMQWHESCGPRITRHSADGFGSSLIAMSVEKQLGGTIERDWLESGLKVTVKIPTKSVCRS